LALEILCAVAGLPADDPELTLFRIDDDDFEAEEHDDEEDEALVSLEPNLAPACICPDGRVLESTDAVDELPLPRVDAVLAWWSGRRGELRPEHRYLYGQPYSLARLHQALQEGPMRRRHAWARELAARSLGTQTLVTHLSSWVQRRQSVAFTELRLDLDASWAPT